jgi:hypothetical protein
LEDTGKILNKTSDSGDCWSLVGRNRENIQESIKPWGRKNFKNSITLLKIITYKDFWFLTLYFGFFFLCNRCVKTFRSY